MLITQPYLITFTGLDQQTDIDALNAIISPIPVEFAILFSAANKGGVSYPKLEFVKDSVQKVKLPLAIHVCGEMAREIFFEGGLNCCLPFLSRVQINGKITPEDILKIESIIGINPVKIIIQYNNSNEEVLKKHISKESNIQILIDSSGGKGKVPKEWVAPSEFNNFEIGFAGGLSSKTIKEQLDKIKIVANGKRFWIDMQKSLRNEENLFDLGKVKEIISLVSDHSSYHN